MATGFNDPTAQRLEPITTGAEPEVVGPLLADALHDPRWVECDVALIAGGKSNLTYRIACDAGEVVLRRPPLGHVLPTAHDMAREHRVLQALDGTAVPVPRVLHFGAADGPLGVSFYVMERVVGHVCRNALPPGYADDREERAAIGGALVDVLAELHAVDPAAVGLEEFGRPAGFVERQLRRWSKQWDASKTGELPALDELRDELVRTLPPQRAAAIVHGDYRLDNTILHPTSPGRIVAVLDWEMSTLGDPLTDLGTLLAYWSEQADDDVLAAARVMAPVTAADGFATRSEVVRRYASRTGFDVSGVEWYQAFAYFKLAVVCQGIAARAAGGAMLGSGFDDAQRIVAPLVAAGRRVLGIGPVSAPGARWRSAGSAAGSEVGGSSHRHPAVDAQHVTGHEAAAGAEQEEDRLVELAGLAAASERRALEQERRERRGVIAELGGHLGGEEARCDGVDADAVAPPLRRQLAREPDHPRLRGDVGRVRDLPDRAQAHHRRNVDDRAAAVRAHPARGQAGQREGRRQVDVEHPRERVGARLQRRRGRPDAGVVDEAVEPAVALDDGLHEPLAVAGVGHVAGDCMDARQLALQLREPLGTARGEHGGGPGGGQCAGDLLSEA